MTTPLMERVWGRGGAHLIVGDAAVVGLLAALVAALAAPGEAGGGRASRAEVEVSGSPVATLDLSRPSETSVDGPLGSTRIEVRDGGVRVLSSPCPRQSCRHGGWIRDPGELLVCLPNEVLVRLPGRRPGAPDGVSR